MKVALDNIVFSLQRTGGISTYWGELLKRVEDADFETLILEDTGVENNVVRRGLTPKSINNISSVLPLRLRRYLTPGKVDADIFHSSYYRSVKGKRVKNIVTLYDFTYEYYRKGAAALVHKIQKGNALRRADGIICISENTRKDLFRFYPDTDPGKVTVIPLAAGSEFKVVDNGEAEFRKLNSESRSGKYVLFVGARGGYKNFSIAVDTVADHEELTLLTVGAPLSDEEKAVLEQKLAGRFSHLTNIDSETLNILYNNAFCLIYPSEYEGFGIPVLEAMRAGCPVVAMNRSSVPEAAGDAALLIDDPVADEFSEQLNLLYSDVFRTEIIDKGVIHSESFSWDHCIHQTFEFYKKING